MTTEPNDAQLDAWLATDNIAPPGEDLIRRIVASAPGAQPTSARDAAPWWRTNWLWPGAGLAGIGLAGSLAGAFAVSIAIGATVSPTADPADRATAFSALPADWSEE